MQSTTPTIATFTNECAQDTRERLLELVERLANVNGSLPYYEDLLQELDYVVENARDNIHCFKVESRCNIKMIEGRFYKARNGVVYGPLARRNPDGGPYPWIVNLPRSAGYVWTDRGHYVDNDIYEDAMDLMELMPEDYSPQTT